MATPPLSALTISILCQLLVSPRSGYRLKRRFEETAMGHFSSSPGAIYPALQRMEAAGWIRGRLDNPESMRASRVYSLAKAGRDVLKTLFESPLTRDDIIHRMDIVLLRFAFMTPLVGRSSTISYLENLAEHLAAYGGELKRQAGQLPGAPLEGMLALQHGIESYKTHLQWARAARQKLKATPSTHRFS